MGLKKRRQYKLRDHCKYCGSKEDLTYDHKHPISLGGTDDIQNLQTLCEKCNKLKSAIPNEVFKRIMEHGIYCFIKKHKSNQPSK